jgi:hypothetical protein
MSKPISRKFRRSITGVALLIATLSELHAGSIVSSAFIVNRPLTADDGSESTDISGLACLPTRINRRVCLVIDDQGTLAQTAVLDGNMLTAAGKIRLLGKNRPLPGIVGIEPTSVSCTQIDRFKDLDGEAVAKGDAGFYVVGSHGCSRGADKFRASSYILAWIPDRSVEEAARFGPQSVEEAPIATSYRMSEVLRLAPTVKAFFGQSLTANGLNIEGLAAIDGTLYAGLRAPVVGTNAYIVAVEAELLFDTTREITARDVNEVPVDLGGRGIRDLAVLSDGRFLVLAGPAQAQEITFALFAVDLHSRSANLVADLIDVPAGAKAEALAVLGQRQSILDLIIMFDGPSGGAPRNYQVNLN